METSIIMLHIVSALLLALILMLFNKLDKLSSRVKELEEN